MAKHTDVATVYLFGDQTDDSRTQLRSLLHTKHDSLLDEFLQMAYDRVKAEVLKRHRSGQADLVQFASLRELLDVEFKGDCKVAVEHAITSICQFGIFFRQCYETAGGKYPDASETCLVGLCTGSLTAAVVSCCRSVAELVTAAAEVTVLSFLVGEFAARTGKLFQCNGEFVNGNNGNNRSWAIAVSTSELPRVEHYLKMQKEKKVSSPYLGVSSPKNVTVCGPPHALLEMISDPEFKNSASVPLSIYAPYHARHLYDLDAIGSLLDPIRNMKIWNLAKSIPIISHEDTRVGTTESPYSSDPLLPTRDTLGEALSSALKAILLEQMDIGALATSLEHRIRANGMRKIRLIPISSAAGSLVQHALGSTEIGMQTTIAKPSLLSDSAYTKNDRHRCKIAIVGSSGRFPGGADTEDALWEILLKGKDVHKIVPASRWNAATHIDKSKRPHKNTSATPYGCWLDDAGLFDARFFGMSPREAEQVDPAQRLALMSAYEALEDGGIVSGQRSSQSSRVGVCFGVTSNDWMETNSAQNIDTYMIPGGNRAFIPGRINYAFKFSGPSYAVDTACSSSLAAIDVACRALWMNEADTMISGGTNVITNPDFTAGLDRGHFLSRTGNCKTFDNDADGYCRGEGVGVVILKRLEDAIQDGDSIKGVIVDIRTNHSAEAESITRPHPKSQSDLFGRVLGGLSPERISYVEMHGTGTQVGDASEMSSVLNAIAPNHGLRRRSKARPVHIGSVKANVGHGEAAAGVTSLIKLLMMLRHGVIPPHIGIKTRINKRFPRDMDERGIRIASEPTPWRCGEQEPRYALLNNFSAAGGNTTLLLEDAPLSTVAERTSALPSSFPVSISAKTSSALSANIRSLLLSIRENPGLDLPSISYTTTARRMHHSHRLALGVDSIAELVSRLTTVLQSDSIGQTSMPQPSVSFVFTGQGGHYNGMGCELYRTNSFFRASIDQYDRLAKLLGFASFLPIIRGDDGEDMLSSGAEASQIAHTSLQMSLLRLWHSWGVLPSSVMGHSLGHYAALNAAGILSDADTLFAVGSRARIFRLKCEPGTHRMLSVRASKAVVESYITQTNGIDIACINGPQDIVVSGKRTDIDAFCETLSKHQIRSTVLDTQYAFHSSQIDHVLDDFKRAIEGIHFRPAQIPIIYAGPENIMETTLDADHLVRHMRETVNVESALEDAVAKGVINRRTHFVEMGHNATLTSIVKKVLGNTTKAMPSLKKNMNDLSSVTESAAWLYEAGVNIGWDEWHRDYAASLQVLRLPQYSWDLKNYWIQYVNDWSLRKGDPVPKLSEQASLLSPTIHEVLGESIQHLPAKIELRTNLNEPKIKAIAHGHKVNGLPLCTPSIYADIALTVGRYLQREFSEPLRCKEVSITNMTIMKALVAVSKESQWLQTIVSVGENYTAVCAFSTLNDNGEVIIQHAKCGISYNSAMSGEDMETYSKEIGSAINAMQKTLTSGTAYRFNTNMIYRMVATLADFDTAYRGLQEIFLDSTTMTATGVVSFSSLPTDDYLQMCAAPPAYLDCFTQLAGFVMNANDASDLGKECFVNHGWGSMTLFEDLTKEGAYECYVKMVKSENTVWKGTLVVIQENRLVAIFKDVELQGVPTRLLHHVLWSAQTAQSRESEKAFSYVNDANTMRYVNTLANSPQTEHSAIDPNFDPGLDQLLAIVSEESGVEKTELRDDIELVDLGIDSLLSLLIAGRLKDDLGFDLGSGITLFDEYKTLAGLKHAYMKSKGSSLDDAQMLGRKSEQVLGLPTPPLESEVPTRTTTSKSWTGERAVARSVTSLVLQEASGTDRTLLFLFPDGSGSAASYVSLPPLSPAISVIALVSPYRHNAESMTCTLESLLTSYINEIKRRQPTGSYTLGGWSSGGVFAFCAAQILLGQGHHVSHILLLDSPPMRVGEGLGQLPDRFYDHCWEVGVFGQMGSSDANQDSSAETKRLIAHFKATVNLLANHRATPLEVPQGFEKPRVSLCWAGKSALDGTRYGAFQREAEDSSDVDFLVAARDDFGAGGWAELLPGISIAVTTLHEWDHFNMMVRDGALALGDIIAGCI